MSAFLPMPLTDEAGEFQYDRIDRPDQASTFIVLLDVPHKCIERLDSAHASRVPLLASSDEVPG